MTNIDDLFKIPSAKRKLEVNQDANLGYKSTKLNASSETRFNGHATAREDLNDQRDTAGPEAPDANEDEVDDADGRFFGGGVTKYTADVLDYIDEKGQDDAVSEVVDGSWLRKTALSFEKKISKNTELRAKFESLPEKFMTSEADLDTDIKALSILSEHPELYIDFAKLGCITSLVSLLSHENTDIAIDAIEIINELTDEDVNASQQQWDAIVDAMIDADLLNLLHENLKRMDENLEADRSGVYYILNVVENLSSQSALVQKIGEQTKFVEWLLARAQTDESPVTQNKQYSAEVLNILLQSSSANRALFVSLDGIEKFLQLVSSYRKKDPQKGTEEEELMENLFDCLTCCADDADGKAKFLEAEGVELCLIMLKEGKASRSPALRLLDHALGGLDGGGCCEALVEANGLKTVFAMYKKRHEREAVEHILGIFASLLRSLRPESAPRIRLLSKFGESKWRIIDNLVQKRREAFSNVGLADQTIEKEKADMPSEDYGAMADEWLSRRLDAGLYTLRTVDIVLAWLVAEDEDAKRSVIDTLADRGEGLEVIRRTLQEQLDTINEDSVDENRDERDMVATLIDFL